MTATEEATLRRATAQGALVSGFFCSEILPPEASNFAAPKARPGPTGGADLGSATSGGSAAGSSS